MNHQEHKEAMEKVNARIESQIQFLDVVNKTLKNIMEAKKASQTNGKSNGKIKNKAINHTRTKS